MRPALAILLVTVSAVAAGCFSSDRLARPAGGTDALDNALPYTMFLCTDGYHLASDLGQTDTCNLRVTRPLSDPQRFDWQGQHGPANEVSVAVDPANPLIQVVAAKDYTLSVIGPAPGLDGSERQGCGKHAVWIGVYATRDGGRSWTNDLVQGFPGDPRGGPLSGSDCGTDPVLAFGEDGRVFLSGLNYGGRRTDGSSAPALPSLPTGPLSGGSDLLTGSQLYFLSSTDGGASWGPVAFASSGDGAAVFNDKQWFAVEPGTSHLLATWTQYLAPAAVLPGSVALPMPSTPADFVVPQNVLHYTESFDGGATWSAGGTLPVGAAAPENSQFVMPAFLPASRLPDGTSLHSVAVSWLDQDTTGSPTAVAPRTTHVAYAEGMLAPTDAAPVHSRGQASGVEAAGPGDSAQQGAGTIFQPVLSQFAIHPVHAGLDGNGTGPSRFRVNTIPVLAVDTSGGQHNGRRYVVWSDQPGPVDSPVTLLERHSDDGVVWSEPVNVTTAAGTAGSAPGAGSLDSAAITGGHGDQLQPAAVVDPDGRLHVAWLDRRNDPDNRLLDVYTAFSDDGGATFHAAVRVSARSFDGDKGFHQSGTATGADVPFIGDYIGISATSQSVTVAWSDTRHAGEPGRLTGSDVYTATLLRDATARSVFDAAFDEA